MAAFERVSQVMVRPQDRQSFIDFRSARLPKKRRVLSIGMGEGMGGPADYNPREHRDPQQRIPVWQAYVNLFRAGIGAGLLGYPLAISQTGMFFGTVLALSCGALIIHMHLVLLKCLNEISRRLRIPIISYRYGFRIAMLHGPPITHCIGRRGPCIIATFMILSQVGICTVFIDFTADSLRDIMDWKASRTAMMFLFVPYMLLEFAMKTLKVVSYVAMIGNALSVGGLALVFYHIFAEPHGEFVHAKIEALPLAFCFGTYLFNLSSVGVVLALDKALVHPNIMIRRWLGVVTVGMGVPLCIAVVFGILGYWSFGTMEENVLRSLPYDDVTTIIAVAMYMTAVGLAYPLQCYPAIQIILEVIKNHDPYEEPSEDTMRLVEVIARPSFVVLTFVTAYFAPFQAPVVGFVGNLCNTMLALVFPALMELCLLYPGPYGKHDIILYKDVMIIIFGLTSWVFGVVLCGILIYVRVAASASPNNVVIAYMIPIQAPFVALVGNLCTTMLALVFPALMELCLLYPGPYGKHNIILYKDVMIIIIGIISCLFGATICGRFLYLRVAASASPNNDEYF